MKRRKKNNQRRYWVFIVAILSAVIYLGVKKYGLSDAETGITDTEKPGETVPEWNLRVVNKRKAIPDDYQVNLVEVPGGERIDQRIYEPLMEMLEAAKEENGDQMPVVASGFRTRKEQKKMYHEKIKEYKREGYSEEEALREVDYWVAEPGHSEHQLGLAVDINGIADDLYPWLQENSYKFGFIFRYPADKTDITGIAQEVWHYRYVGVAAATEIHDRNICLEEYYK